MILLLLRILIIILALLNCILIAIIFRNNKKVKIENANIVKNEIINNKQKIKTLSQDYISKIDIPIYYINLDRSPIRKQFMEDQFHKYNIKNFKRIKGIDGKKIIDLKSGIIDGINFVNNYNYLTCYEIGCLLSHLRAIIDAYSNNLDKVLIMEDDCCLDLMPFWNDNLSILIEKNIPNDWEIAQLFSFNCYNHNIENKFYLKDKDTIRCGSSMAYIINYNGMKKIIEYIKPFITIGKIINNKLSPSHGESDSFIYSIAKTYYISLPLFYQNSIFESIIHSDHEIIQNIETNKLLKSYIKNKIPEKNLFGNKTFSYDDVLKIKKYLKTVNVSIVGTARDIEKYINNIINKIEMISNLFNKSEILIFENDSKDKTLSKLNEWKFNSKNNITIISENNIKGLRTQRLSYARNLLLEKALQSNYEYLIVIDLDDVNSELTEINFLSSFNYENTDWAVMCSNQKNNYYDLWALRTFDDWMPFDCWECKNITGDKKYCVDDRFKKISPDFNLIDVKSCFGGLAIYKTKYLKNCEYYGGQNKKEVCEHVNLNNDIINKNKGKIFINTQMINS